MKTRFFLPALCAVLFAISLRAFAWGDGGQGCCCQSNACDISGTEVMFAVVDLIATSNAPAGATGVATIESENECGNESAKLKVRTAGLDAGDYILSITLQSTGTNIILAGFTAGGCGDGDDEDDDGGDGGGWFHRDGEGGDGGDGGSSNLIPCCWGGFTNWGVWTNWCDTNLCSGSNFVLRTKTKVWLPSDVNPTDISEITVSDTNGNPILVGDVTNPAPSTVINISASVQVTPGAAAPSATGKADLWSTALKGKWKHQFNFAASGVTASTNFKMDVNGKASGAARSNKSGQMTIKKLPSKTSALHQLLLLDKSGNAAASANF
jgi:hypothetical protein